MPCHTYKADDKHGFIQSQKEGMRVFAEGVDPNLPIIVAEAVWQYAQQLLHGLITHKVPILTLANSSASWPGLVGMLNLKGSLTRAGEKYASLWSEDFTSKAFFKKLDKFLSTGKLELDTSHVVSSDKVKVDVKHKKLGKELAQALQKDKAITGVFDEQCMGVYNAIICDELLASTGV